MKRSIAITSVESKAGFPEQLLEKYVQENLPLRNWRQNKTSGMGGFNDLYMEFESCGAETPVGGSLEIFFAAGRRNEAKSISVPVNTRFFVFCTRKENDNFKISWISSLS